MIPFLPGSRRRAAEADSHVRARTLLAERMDREIIEADVAWLDAHLLTCEACTAAAADYAEQRTMLRALPMPEAPRDLWARTSARIELESGGSASRRSARRSVVPLGALSGALVVAVVVGASLLSQPTVAPPPSASTAPLPSVVAASVEPRPTPIEVAIADVGWALQNDDGSYALTFANVDQVCGSDIRPDCAPLDPPTSSTLRLDAQPRAIVKSPTQDQLVVVEAGTRDTGGTVYVLPVPSPEPSPVPTVAPSPSVVPSSTPGPSASPTVSPSPTTTPPPSPSVEPSSGPTVEPSASPSPSPSASPPGGDTAGGEPIAIAADVIVVGESAAYSGDGRWFAFSARPADGTTGPDIYLWQAGDDSARPITTDHRSVFSAWVGDRILGSRVIEPPTEVTATASPSPESSADASPSPGTTVSFLYDPVTAQETILAGTRIWRPVVDPTSRFVIFWDGSIEVDAKGVDWRPGEGRLVLATWDASQVPADPASPGTSPSPSLGAPPSPEASPSGPVASPSPARVVLATLTEGVVRDWDVHWDETGTRFALWLADPVDPDVGTISLHEVDPATNSLDPKGPVLAGVPALAGFSIGDGRLAWATPPGQGGEGSRIVVLAWQGDAAGQVEGAPETGTDPVVVIR